MYPNGGGQWGQPTGYAGQQQQQPSFLQSQPTGYPGQPPFQQRPMQTGMQPQQTGAFMGPQQTGMMMGGMNRPGGGQPMMGGLGPGGSGQLYPQQQQQQQQSRFLSPMQSQQTGMMMPSQQTGMPMGMPMRSPQPTGGYMGAQPTGMMGPQPTGFMGAQPTGMPMDPRFQLMTAQFLPAATPFSGAPVAQNMNFSSASMQPANFQSTIQNLSQQQQGSREPKIPWALSKEERKSYDSIFRAWDQQGSGFVSGEVAQEVFGQSGLDRDSLMQIWHLSDTENRGKLNLAEFHVAMGLIYRGLNGNDIPPELPHELVPPSAKQLNESVDFLKDLLKRDTNVRTSTALNLPEAGSNRNASYGKQHSLYQNPVAPKQDATAYKHEDKDESGGYRSSSRHLDRKAVRFGGESKADDFSEMKRQLANTQRLLDEQDDDDDEDDREIDKEMDDLRFRIRRIQDDIDYYNRRGGRDAAEQRRKAERELMHLMHERLPQLEKRVEEKDRRKRDKKLSESKERDRRNDRSASGRGSPYTSARHDDDRRDRYDDSSRDRGEYLRGSYERRDDRERDRYDDDRERDRDRDRYDDRSSKSSAPSDRQAPPPPAPTSSSDRAAPVPPPSQAAAAPPPPPVAPAAPATTSSTPSGPPKNLSPEEKQAWIRSEAQRRIQERMRALGAAAPPASATPATDSGVEDRLKADKAEAEARAAEADQEAAAREQARRARLEESKIAKDKAAVTTVKAELNEAADGPNAPPEPVLQAALEQVDEEEAMIRRREEVLAKEKAERMARLKKLEEEEAEAQRQEEAFKQKQGMFANKPAAASSSLPAPSRKKASAPPPPPSRARAVPPPSAASTADTTAPPPPPAPPAPSMPASDPSVSPQQAAAMSPSTNPFHRMQGGAAPPAGQSTPGGTNPFFRAGGAAASPSPANSNLPAPSRAQALVAPTSANTSRDAAPSAPKAKPAPSDDDWGESDKEDDDDDDAEGPGSTTRATRQNLAAALFSGLVPSGGSGRSTPTPAQSNNARSASQSIPAPPAPPMAPAAPAAPPAPAAPRAPSAPAAAAPSSGPVNRGALLGQIQGGLRLKKAQTRDASGPPVSGKVIGDASAPVQAYVPPPSPPAAPAAPSGPDASFEDSFAMNPNRQSVDWANKLAADQMNGTSRASAVPEEQSVREEEEESEEEFVEPEDPEGHTLAERDAHGLKPQDPTTYLAADTPLAVAGDAIGESQEEFDLSQTVRVRTLYPYAGQRDEDLGFDENAIVIAHPAKDGGNDWMYGTLLTGGSGKKGTFPKAYVAPLTSAVTARALYDFAGSSLDEASFSEGQELNVVDQDDASWWRVEQGDSIKIAPASYLELSAKVHPTHPRAVHHPPATAIPSRLLAIDTTSSPAIDPLATPTDATPVQSVSKESPPAHTGTQEDIESEAEDDDDSDSTTTGWSSSSDEDEDPSMTSPEPETNEDEDPEAQALRAAERMRVLEAAGLLVNVDRRDPPPPPGARPAEDLMRRRTTKRGPGPEIPVRKRALKKPPRPERPQRPAPAPTAVPEQPEERMEDAYDRFVKLQRELASSKDVAPTSSPPPRSSLESSIPMSAVSEPPEQSSAKNRVVSRPTPEAMTPTDTGIPESRSGGFLHSLTAGFRNRGSISSVPERKATPVISGPMSGGPVVDTASLSSASSARGSIGSSQPSAAMTNSSWSSFMGGDALASLPDKERKRQEAIFELCQTEQTHVRDLQTIVEVFYNAIEEQRLLDDKARLVIFANIEDILLAAVSLLSDLEERQRASRLYVDHIGDLLARHLPSMKVYLPYCTNQSTAAQILSSERKRNPVLDSQLRRLQSGPGRGLDLASYLLTPMQRLTRYPLLIGQIQKYTEPDHEDYQSLQQGHRIAESLLETTNEKIRENESRERLKALSQTLYIGQESRLDLTKPTRAQGDRRILKEETLLKAKSKSGRKLTLILCNDLLLILSGPNLYRMPSPLEEVFVKEASSSATRSKDDSTLKVILGGTENINLKCSTPRNRHLWQRAIESARSDCLTATMSAQGPPRHRRRISEQVPIVMT